jgi:hypothetical protein
MKNFSFENIQFITNNAYPLQCNEPRFRINAFEYYRNEILTFSELENNWDGYGSIPLIKSIAEKSIKFIASLHSSDIDSISDIFSNSHGTLMIEWENSNEEKVCLEIGVLNYSYFVQYNNQPTKYFKGDDINSDIKNITQHLRELFGKESTLLFS